MSHTGGCLRVGHSGRRSASPALGARPWVRFLGTVARLSPERASAPARRPRRLLAIHVGIRVGDQLVDLAVAHRIETGAAHGPGQPPPSLARFFPGDSHQSTQGFVAMIAGPGHQHDELVAPQSRHDVRGAEALEQQPGEVLKQLREKNAETPG